jgi:hypothetical protein
MTGEEKGSVQRNVTCGATLHRLAGEFAVPCICRARKSLQRRTEGVAVASSSVTPAGNAIVARFYHWRRWILSDPLSNTIGTHRRQFWA